MKPNTTLRRLVDEFESLCTLPEKRKVGWTKEEVIAELQRVAKLLGKTPTGDEFREHASMSIQPVRKLFGSWNDALCAAGFELNHFRGCTKSDVIQELKRVTKSLGRTPFVKEFTKHASMHVTVVYRMFGTYSKALRAAGLELSRNHGYTKSDILKELKRVAKLLGETPTQEKFNKHASVDFQIIRRRFGSWNKALRAAGLEPTHFVGYTKSDVLKELKRISQLLGKTPIADEFDKHADMKRSTVQKLFGTWNNALKNAGLECNIEYGYTKSDVLKELKRISKLLGKTPFRWEFSKHARMNGITAEKLFGTWNNTLRAAGLELNLNR